MSIGERRKEIPRLLLGGTKITVMGLAEYFSVSRSTIKRDLLMLTVDDGWHIEAKPGPGGGVYISDYEHPHKHILSQEQIHALEAARAFVSMECADILGSILRAYS
jgi:predicted DNA-binding transcriptional regulator YafY